MLTKSDAGGRGSALSKISASTDVRLIFALPIRVFGGSAVTVATTAGSGSPTNDCSALVDSLRSIGAPTLACFTTLTTVKWSGSPALGMKMPCSTIRLLI